MNGETITLIDSSNARFRNFVIEGNSIQDSEPTPETPIEIESVESVEVKQCGLNLVDFSDFEKSSLNPTYENDELTIVGKEGQYMYITYIVTDLIKNNPGKNIVFTCEESIVSNQNAKSNIQLNIHYSDGTPSDYLSLYDNKTGIQYQKNIPTNTKNIERALLNIYTNNTTTQWENTLTIKKPMLYFGTIEDDPKYKEHQNFSATIPLSEPLRSLPNGMKDTIEKDGIHRRVGEIVLNGSENWNLDDVYEGIYEYSISINDVVVNYSEDDVRVMSNYFKGVAWRDSWTKEDVVVSYMNRNSIRIMTKTHTSIDAFKNWLSTNNVTVQYELANEVIEPFTEEQQKAYDNIINNGTYKTTTNIYSSNEVAPTFKVEYSKDLETIINNLG